MRTSGAYDKDDFAKTAAISPSLAGDDVVEE